VFETGDAERQIDVAPPERRQPTESESDEDREWAKSNANALALLTANRGAQWDVVKRVLEEVADSTDDPIHQLNGQLTQVTNLLFSMTFIASSLAEKVAELSEEDREAVLEAIEELIASRED